MNLHPGCHPDVGPSVGGSFFPTLRDLTRGACVMVLMVLGVSKPVLAQVHPLRPDTIASVMEPLEARVALPEVLGSASALVIDLDSADVPAALSLADMLRAMPLVRVRANSRGEAHITLRGSESRQVAVSLDGIPLTIGWDNRADLSVVPLTGVTKITAVRGLSALLAGPNVLGGVVQLGIAPTYVPPDAPGGLGLEPESGPEDRSPLIFLRSTASVLEAARGCFARAAATVGGTISASGGRSTNRPPPSPASRSTVISISGTPSWRADSRTLTETGWESPPWRMVRSEGWRPNCTSRSPGCGVFP
jgi:outer membrane receptor protein involved in Fe transport